MYDVLHLIMVVLCGGDQNVWDILKLPGVDDADDVLTHTQVPPTTYHLPLRLPTCSLTHPPPTTYHPPPALPARHPIASCPAYLPACCLWPRHHDLL